MNVDFLDVQRRYLFLYLWVFMNILEFLSRLPYLDGDLIYDKMCFAVSSDYVCVGLYYVNLLLLFRSTLCSSFKAPIF